MKEMKKKYIKPKLGMASEILNVLLVIQEKICSEICSPLLHKIACLKLRSSTFFV